MTTRSSRGKPPHDPVQRGVTTYGDPAFRIQRLDYFHQLPGDPTREDWAAPPPPPVARVLEKRERAWERVYEVRRRFRESDIWKVTRQRIRAERPYCQKCGAPSKEVDHVVAIYDGGSPLDDSNLQALCSKCHAKKTSRDEEKRFKRRLSEYAWISLGNGISQRYRETPSQAVLEEVERLRAALRRRPRNRVQTPSALRL